MERGGGESPRLRESPERRGSSSPDIGGPPPKMGRLELNGSPTGHRSRHNGAPQRPFSGKILTTFTVPTFILYMFFPSFISCIVEKDHTLAPQLNVPRTQILTTTPLV